MSRIVIGVVLRPSTFEMAMGVFDRSSGNEVTTHDIASDDLIATGSLDYGQYGKEYTVSATVTDYPRAHATPGVTHKYRKKEVGGGGWGTPLYVAEATAAYIRSEHRLAARSGTEGDGAGISSQEGKRSQEAEKWWERATSAGLAESINKCTTVEGEYETDDNEFEYDDSDMPSRVDSSIKNVISGSDDEIVDVNDVSYRIVGTWRGTKKGEEEECGEFNILTHESCVDKGLILLSTTGADVSPAPAFYAWGNDEYKDIDNVYADVMRVVNVGYLPQKPKGMEAMRTLVNIARNRLKQQEVSDMIDRFNEKVDAGAVRYEKAEVAIENPYRPITRKVRLRGRVATLRLMPKRLIVPSRLVPARAVFYGKQRNPSKGSPLSLAMKKNLRRLYDLRVEMGYGALAGLP
jgi:hypothetical protein